MGHFCPPLNRTILTTGETSPSTQSHLAFSDKGVSDRKTFKERYDHSSVSGYIRYYTPTRGRCAAFRHAFKSCADLMESQGIPMRLNAGYDFRPGLSSNVSLQNDLKNQATLDGVTGLALWMEINYG